MSFLDIFRKKFNNGPTDSNENQSLSPSLFMKSPAQLRLEAEQLLGQANASAELANHTSTPELFFSAYEDTIQALRKLVPMESAISFGGRAPSSILSELESSEKREAAISDMVDRCLGTCRWQFLQEAEEELSPYWDRLPQFVRKRIATLPSDWRQKARQSSTVGKCTPIESNHAIFPQERDVLSSETKPSIPMTEGWRMKELQQKQKEQAEKQRLQARREEVVRNRLAESSRQEAELKQRREAHRRERAEKVQGMDYSALLRDAIRFASEQMYITKEEMQDEYPGVDAGTKRKLLEDLYDLKAIQPRTQDGSWLSLIDPQRAQSLIWDLEKDQNDSSGGCDWPAVNIDAMEGHEFEHYCAELLEHNGFTEVEVTPASGDFGVDVLAKKDGITYAIQCKCYSDTVGNHAVQEALSGAQYYHRMVAVVMTNNYFTPAAIETAHRTNVLLWDRDTVLKMTEQTEKSH